MIESHLTLNQLRTGMNEELFARHQQSLFLFSRRTKSNERPPHETRVALSLLWHVLSNRGLLLSLADNLHNHQKKKESPQDPYVVVDLSSLLPELRLLHAFPLGCLL